MFLTSIAMTHHHITIPQHNNNQYSLPPYADGRSGFVGWFEVPSVAAAGAGVGER